MENYKKELKNQLTIIRRLLKQNEKNLERYKDIEGKSVKVSYSNGCSQYYLSDETTKQKTYVSKTKLKTVKKIVQRDYELAVNKKLKEMEARIVRFCKTYDYEEIKTIYEKLPRARRELVFPIIETDEQYIDRWKAEHPGNQNEFPYEGSIITARGERVRSKSEKIIADLFDKYNVPYSYEPSLVIGNNHIVNPDFVVLNVKTRKTIYWEHLGLIDMEQYAVKNLSKLNDYNMAGFDIGEDLIITMESSAYGFDSRDIESKIRKYCL